MTENTLKEVQGRVIYQIFWRAFTPEGTIKSAEKLLPHLAKLGIDIIYTTPFVQADSDENREYWSNRQRQSGTNNPKNPYRISDYFKMDEEYGKDEDFVSFVKTAHSLGLKVLCDLVYLHCGPSCELINAHPEYFKKNSDGTIMTNYYRFAVFDLTNQGAKEYFYGNMEYFITKFDIDGFRCDCGSEIPLEFWREGIKRVYVRKPNLIMFNEGQKAEYLGEIFDIDYDWNPISGFNSEGIVNTNGHPDAAEFVAFCKAEDSIGNHGRHIRFIENHDIANDAYDTRLEKRIGSDGVEAYTFLNFLTDGIPYIYNGFEIADDNRHSIMANRFHGNNLIIDWSNALTEKGKRRYNFTKELISLKHSHTALKCAPNVWLENSLCHQVLSFTRSDENEEILVIVNLHPEPCEVKTDIPYGFKNVLCERYTGLTKTDDGKVKAVLGGYGFIAIQK